MKRNPPKGNIRRVQHIDKNLRGVTTSMSDDTIQFESFQELILIIILSQLARTHRIKRITSQPFRLIFEVGGHTITHVPDFKVELNDGSIEIHDVTISSRQSKESQRI